MDSGPGDEMLLLAVAERDMGAFRTLYERHAGWLAIRLARRCNDRDVFLAPFLAGAAPGSQEGLVPEALRRANAYLEAGADCVYPIALWETDALRRFTEARRRYQTALRSVPAASVPG
jgi:hypothetical protein